MWNAAISAAPTAAMNAMRTEVRMRPGLGLSSSVINCCNHAAVACSCCKAAGTHHPERRAEISLLLVIVCSTLPLDRYYHRPARARTVRVVILEENSE